MNQQKILFVDLDDTLLNSEKQITPDNRQAIREALDAGHHIVINSGRPLMGITAQIEALGLNHQGCYAIAYNGGTIYDCHEKKILLQRTIPLPYIQYIYQESQKFGLHFQTYDSEYVIAAKDAPVFQTYVERIGVPGRIDPLCPDNLTQEPVKALIIGDESRKQSEAYREHMQEWASGKVDIFYSNQTYMEHVPTGVSKGNAMRTLSEMLHVPMTHTYAAGDAENDIPMLKAAHMGIAVANAAAAVKAAADAVTVHDCNHDAIAEIIYQYLLS